MGRVHEAAVQNKPRSEKTASKPSKALQIGNGRTENRCSGTRNVFRRMLWQLLRNQGMYW